MPWMSWKGWSQLVVAGCALLGVAACAPNSARTPLDPSSAAGQEDRYETLLRLGAAARTAGDPAAAVAMYQKAIAHNRGRVDAYVLLGDSLVDLKAYDDAAKTYQDALDRDADNLAAERGYARAMLGLNRPETLSVQITGETATVSVPDGHTVKLKRDGGVWRVEDFD